MAVFTGATAPTAAPPTRLTFTAPGGTSFTSLSPTLGQTFHVGDGLTSTVTGQRRQFQVPAGATSMWFGFQDGHDYTSPPGYYNDNTGSLTVTVQTDSSPPPILQPLPNLDGGTSVGFWHTSDAFEECTTAFNVSRPNSQRFALTAKHCIDGNDRNFDQRTNVQVAAHQPMTITTDNLNGPTSLTNTLRIATGMDCTPPSSPIVPASPAPIVVGTQTSPGGYCVLPSDNPKPRIGDLVAFKPDAPTTVSAAVQTKHGVLPVLGVETMAPVARNGDTACHYGAGSARNLGIGKAEHCGELPRPARDGAGLRRSPITHRDSDRLGSRLPVVPILVPQILPAVRFRDSSPPS